MKRMKNKSVLTVIALLFTVIVSSIGVAAFAETADAADAQDFYVAFSNQNYAIRNANKMTLVDDEYLLEKVSVSGAADFYVTDNKGVKYYAYDGENMKVKETAVYNYNIKFSPDKIYGEEENGYAATASHITYAFYVPASYSVTVAGAETELTYNPYFTAYERYHISAVEIKAGENVVYGVGDDAETHEIASDGVYRILFTPTRVNSGSEYAFNADGQYGSGDEYIYNVYVEDASEYFAVFEEGAEQIKSDAESAEINGKTAYPLTRYEQNTVGEEYRFGEIFTAARDTVLKYSIYEKTVLGDFRPIDDDNDADTTVSKITVADAGWYALSFAVQNEGYLTTVRQSDRNFGGYFAVGDFNNYGFGPDGGVDIDAKYGFTEVEDGDGDYNADYKQYLLYLTVSAKDVSGKTVDFYITNGTDKYKNGTDYISLNTAGKYKILFSDEHIYSQTRRYRYTLIDEAAEGEELEISTAEQFLTFAEKCTESADYSINLSVYLMNDIDFSGVDVTPVKTFGGKFYGGYHSLKNIKISGDGENLAVFQLVTRKASIERLTVENLTLDGKNAVYCGFIARNYGKVFKVNVSGSILGDNCVGGIAAYNGVSTVDENASTIDSDNVQQTAQIEACLNTATVVGKSNVGGIAGFNTGDITASANEGTVRPNTANSTSNLTNVGGIAGLSAGKIADCENTGAVGEAQYATYVGGIAGFCTGENYFAVNRGKVLGRKYVGGIIGGYGNVSQNPNDGNDLFGGLSYEAIVNKYFSNGDSNEVVNGARHGLQYLQNFGDVRSDNYAGGVMGNCDYQNITIGNSLSVGNVTTVGGGYLGGIVAHGEQIAVIGCFSSGNLTASGASANYVGGIAGLAAVIENCTTNAAISGDDYTGGIAGLVKNYINSCYVNALIINGGKNKNVGCIAGFAESYNKSLDPNGFPEKFAYNYCTCNLGGIGGTEYGENYNYAAVQISVDKLLSEGSLSPHLNIGFSHEYWQGGGKNSFPVLTYMSQVQELDEIDNESELFAKYAENFGSAMTDVAKLTYTVVFMEWNKDNGDLTDDGGEYLYTNFQPIYTVRTENGSTVSAPELKFATLTDGQWFYSGKDKIYFVSLKNTAEINGNTVVYAEYSEAKTTVATADGKVLVEGLFHNDTEAELVRTGDYYSLKFTLNGKEIKITDCTVKFKKPTADGDYSVYTVSGGEAEKVESSVYGEYICFKNGGKMFFVSENESFRLTDLEIGLITTLAAFVAIALAVAFRKWRNNRKTGRQADSEEIE